MGCVSSKKARAHSQGHSKSTKSGARAEPGPIHVGPLEEINVEPVKSSKSGPRAEPGPIHVGSLEEINVEPEKEVVLEGKGDVVDDWESWNAEKSGNLDNVLDDLKAIEKRDDEQTQLEFKIGRLPEVQLAAAEWPAWLTAVAEEAINGWVPLRSDTYQRSEKIGQGTYSTVYRARDLKTGKMVAVKKVQFNTFIPDSVTFMAREILIIRKLDHPNIMKLQGIITSRFSCSIHLVFEYMEHDLAGLLSCPDIKFTESQIKCYMQQLLSGVEHCHSRGIMHRDIKTSNILVNNEGILKLADFGLANFVRPESKQPLTSRVVTLWYRPPELLLGSTNYGESVDLWSVGCVFAELFIGRPLLKGRTEAEQLHKIFKLCGSPPDNYWRKSRFPLARMFKPQQPYESKLRERCKEFPKSAIGLIETFLSVEPYKRGTAFSALNSEYFNTKPYACDPSSFPEYPPNKEIDAKIREDYMRRQRASGPRAETGSRNPWRVPKASQESSEFNKMLPAEGQLAGRTTNLYRRKASFESRPILKQPNITKSEVSQASQTTQKTSTQSVQVQVSAYSGFASAKPQKQPDVFTRLHSQPISRGPPGSDGQSLGRAHSLKPTKRANLSQELAEDYGNKKKKGRVAVSRQMTHQSQETASGQHEQARQVHRTRFHKGADFLQ